MSILTKADLQALRERSESAVEELNESRHQDKINELLEMAEDLISEAEQLDEGKGNTVRRKEKKSEATGGEFDKAVEDHDNNMNDPKATDKERQKSRDHANQKAKKFKKQYSATQKAKDALDEGDGNTVRRTIKRKDAVDKRRDQRFDKYQDHKDSGDMDKAYDEYDKSSKDFNKSCDLSKKIRDKMKDVAASKKKKVMSESDELLDLAADLINMAELLDEESNIVRRANARKDMVDKRKKGHMNNAENTDYDIASGDAKKIGKAWLKSVEDRKKAQKDSDKSDRLKAKIAKHSKVTESFDLYEASKLASELHGLSKKD